MSAREIQDQKAIARDMFVQQAARANADVSANPRIAFKAKGSILFFDS